MVSMEVKGSVHMMSLTGDALTKIADFSGF